MMQSEQHVGLMQSTPIEPSPVVSNTTQRHDRLGNVVNRMLVCDTDTERFKFEQKIKGNLNAEA